MYGNAYYMNTQNSIDRIDGQIKELEAMRSQLQRVSQPAINQTFQLAPNIPNGIKYVNSVDDVRKELVFNDSIFLNKDFNMLWLKNAKGEIKTYELKEIIEKDEKDLIIEALQNQINEMKGRDKDEQPSNTDTSEQDKDNKSTGLSDGN